MCVVEVEGDLGPFPTVVAVDRCNNGVAVQGEPFALVPCRSTTF